MLYNYSKKNGILKSLYTKNSKYFAGEDLFSYSSSKNGNSNKAFDFSTTDIWVDDSNTDPSTKNYIIFCLVKGAAKIIGCEITTGTGSWRPYQWAFSGSNNQINWKGNKTYTYSMQESQSYYFTWTNKEPFKCYRIDLLKHVGSSSRGADIQQIEIFGYFYQTYSFGECTKGHANGFYPLISFCFSLLVFS